MKKILSVFVLGVGLTAVAGVAANYTLIRSNDGMFFERKSKMGFEDVYYDTRDWGAMEMLKHPDIAAAVAGHGIKKAFSSEESSSVSHKAKGAIDKSRKAAAEGLEKAAEAIKP